MGWVCIFGWDKFIKFSDSSGKLDAHIHTHTHPHPYNHTETQTLSFWGSENSH